MEIVKALRAHGYQALFAGGCVRDMLLGRPAKDYDVATDAEPADVIRLFKRTLKVGAQFGVVIVLMDDQGIEVATFRSDAGYVDGRRPVEVRFTTAEQDALRRDFTVNGMFYDPVADQVIDYVGGQADLQRRVVRTIGDPADRFSEDYLRMLRAVRFSTQLGFSMDPATYSAICACAPKIVGISGERISMELEGILTCPGRAHGARALKETGLAAAIFPGMGGDAMQTAVGVLGRLRGRTSYPLALAALLVACRSDEALRALKVLKLSRTQTKHVRFLLDRRGVLLQDPLSLADLKRLLAGPLFWDLYELQRAIQKAGAGPVGALVQVRRRVRSLAGVELRPEPLLNGHDLMRLGMAPGPGLGQLADQLYGAQLEGVLISVEQAKAWAKRWMARRQDTEHRTQNTGAADGGPEATRGGQMDPKG